MNKEASGSADQGKPSAPRLHAIGTRPGRVPVRRILAAMESMYPGARCGLDFSNPFELLVATILSAQCTDRLVNRITPRLFERYPSPAEIACLMPEELEQEIKECGLYRTKARNILSTCQRLLEEHGGEVPCKRKELENLPGVGRKTASVVLSNAFGVPAIAVDTHVLRVANRLGLAEARDPLETERQLRRRIPRRRWFPAHHRLIAHGRELCRARNPLCHACELRPLCRYARQASHAAD